MLLLLLRLLVFLVLPLEDIRSDRPGNPSEHRAEHASAHLVSHEPAAGAAN